MQFNKVDICGVNTAKLKVFDGVGKDGAAKAVQGRRQAGAGGPGQREPAAGAQRHPTFYSAGRELRRPVFRWDALD